VQARQSSSARRFLNSAWVFRRGARSVSGETVSLTAEAPNVLWPQHRRVNMGAGMDLVGSELANFRCRVRTAGCTISIDCLAPSALAAAHVVGMQALQEDPAPWVQVVVSRWSAELREYVAGENAVVVTREDRSPAGAATVVFLSSNVVALHKPRSV
jgi:hypothetical protein